jgi:SAM-dependent methyltransferase
MDLVELKDGNAHRHPWELARAKSVLSILATLDTNGTVADVGAGDIYFAGLLADQIGHDVLAVDIGYDTVGREGKVVKFNHISDLPHEGVDLVLLMDVIEHIEDVDAFLNELMPKIKPGGTILITVPAYQSLFSAHDVFLLHYRRYNKKLLNATLAKQPVKVDRMFYFFTSLFFARTAALAVEKLKGPGKADGVGNWKHAEDTAITKLITGVLNTDFKLNNVLSKIGITLPGLTLCAICRKKP